MFIETKNPAGAATSAGLHQNNRELKPGHTNLEPRARCVNVDHMLAALKRAGELQRLARGRVDDPDFSWRRWASYTANELLAAAPGDHAVENTETTISARRYERTTTTTTRSRVIRWPRVSAAVVLCYGAHRVFDRPDQAPEKILAAVKEGVADALRRGRRIRYTAADIGKALGVTAAEKLAAKAWSIEAVDVTPDEWAEIMRQRRNELQRARRRAKGVASLSDSIAAQARELGIKPNTLRARLRRQRARVEEAQGHVPFVKPPNIYIDTEKLHERDTPPPRQRRRS